MSIADAETWFEYTGSAVAKFTGTTIHSRLAALDSYSKATSHAKSFLLCGILTFARTRGLTENGEYEKALKTLYLKTDEDLRAGMTTQRGPDVVALCVLTTPHPLVSRSPCSYRPKLLPGPVRLYRRLWFDYSRWPDHCRESRKTLDAQRCRVGNLTPAAATQANSGDSRSVLSYQGFGKAMSHDHKPTNVKESERITSAGGYVEFGRVNGAYTHLLRCMVGLIRWTHPDIRTSPLFTGNLALSRAIGDFEFKQNYGLEPEKQIVTADPDIEVHRIDGEEEFLVLACDGESGMSSAALQNVPQCLPSLRRYLGLSLIATSHRLYSTGFGQWRRLDQDLRRLDGQVPRS